MNVRNNIRMSVMAALMAAIICVVTMLVQIPSPFKGYINPGDAVVLFAGWMLSPVYGFLGAGLGSAMADVFSGYAIYAPATFIIKGLMAVVACVMYRLLEKRIHGMFAAIISGVMAEILMIAGYFVYEGILYGFGAASLNIISNTVQGVAGVLIGCVLIRLMGIVQRNKVH